MIRRWIANGILLFVVLMIAGCETATPTAQSTKSPNPGNIGLVQRPTKPATFTLTPSATRPTPTPRPSPTSTSTPPPLPTIAPEFWATVGAAPDTLIVLQTSGPAQAVGDIAVMSIDGTYYRQLTTAEWNRDPRLSPDRRRIAFRAASSANVPILNRRAGNGVYEGNYNVRVITVDGTRAWDLTNSEQPRSIPDWSADSQKVLFSEGVEHALIEIEVDSRARREFTRGAYSPRYRPGGGAAYITEGGGLAWIDKALTIHTLVPTETLPSMTTVGSFVWLPDGQHVIYSLLDKHGDVRFTDKSSLWIMDANGENPTQLIGLGGFRYDELLPSADVRLLAVHGHGFGDGCVPSSVAEFLVLAPDLKSVQALSPDSFAGVPSGPMGNYMLLVSGPIWISSQWAIGRFHIACADQSLFGWYLLNPVEQRAIQITRDKRLK